MIAIHFDKAYADQVLEAARTGRPIPVPAGGWTQNSELALAGIMAAAAKTRGPQTGPVGRRAYELSVWSMNLPPVPGAIR